MDFVLQLHSHLPYVLNHGRWPHGSDWICEATLDTYLPLLDTLLALKAEAVGAPITIGITPVLANQLASPVYVDEMRAFFKQRLEACDEAPPALIESGDSDLLPLVDYWHQRLTTLRELFEFLDGDLLGAFRQLERQGRIETITSAATHGFLPLLGRDESIDFQLAVGRAEHKRLFHREPSGVWLPECAYRPGGPWAPHPSAPASPFRRGIEDFVLEAGLGYFYVDAHLASAGEPLGLYAEGPATATTPEEWKALTERSPYRAYRVSRTRGGRSVAALVRDPRATMQVWSRHQGYPGDGAYLEFHKIRFPGGLKLWRVTGNDVELGQKQPYDPDLAQETARAHAAHFVSVLRDLARTQDSRRGVITVPFDTELFGHWWFEGVDFLGDVFRVLSRETDVRPIAAAKHLARTGPHPGLRLATGSWGANGDFGMWLNPDTAWTWERLWPLEHAFWQLAPAALERPEWAPVLAQAARSLLLAQSSDWQFIISTGEVADYGIRRFNGHADELGQLLTAVADGSPEALGPARELAATLSERDAVFPDILTSLAAVVQRQVVAA